MIQAKPFVTAAVVGSLGLLAVMVVLSSVSPPQEAAFVALLGPDPPLDGRGTRGDEVRLSAFDGEAPVAALAHSPFGFPVIVVKVPTGDLSMAASVTGVATDKWAIAHPYEPGMSLLAYNAKSTHLGCTVQLFPDGGRMPAGDGRDRTVGFIDPCHHGQWDALTMGSNWPGTVAPRPLGVVPIALGAGTDPIIFAGPSIDQARPFDAARIDLRLRPPE